MLHFVYAIIFGHVVTKKYNVGTPKSVSPYRHTALFKAKNISKSNKNNLYLEKDKLKLICYFMWNKPPVILLWLCVLCYRVC